VSTEAEREIEDLFNAEVFGVDTSQGGVTPIPQEVPESKPVEQAAQAVEEDGQTEGTPEAEVVEEAAEEEAPEAVEEGTEEVEEEAEEYVSWAKKQFGDDIDLDSDSSKKLAKSAFEKERMLGKKAEESKQLKQEAEARAIQQRIDALNTPGNLTPEEDGWVDEAIVSGDPAEWAYSALQGERPDLYAAVLDRWAAQGESESRMARTLHSRVLQVVSQPQPSREESYAASLGSTFIELGLNIESHGPAILAKAEELGSGHPAVAGMMSPDGDVRRIATRAIYDLISAGKTTVSKAQQDDVVAARVKEQQLREKAAGVTTGKPHVAQPKKSPFWEEFDAELSERGWDGNAPTYGRD